jgi:acetoacetyl-[acyl-carrier protein] synthase
VAQQASEYDRATSEGKALPIYKFDHNVLSGEDLQSSEHGMRVPGYDVEIDLNMDVPYREWL